MKPAGWIPTALVECAELINIAPFIPKALAALPITNVIDN